MKRKAVGSDTGVKALHVSMRKLSVLEKDAREAAMCIDASATAMVAGAVASVETHVAGAAQALDVLAYQSQRAKESARRSVRAQTKLAVDAEEHASTNVDQLMALCAALQANVLPVVDVDALATADIAMPSSIILKSDGALPVKFASVITDPVSIEESTVVVPPYGKLRPALQNVVRVTMRDAHGEPVCVDASGFVLLLTAENHAPEQVRLQVTARDVHEYDLAFSLKISTHKNVATDAALLFNDVLLHAWSFWTYEDGPVLVKCAREEVAARTPPVFVFEDEPELDFRISLSAMAHIEVPLEDAQRVFHQLRMAVHFYGIVTQTFKPSLDAYTPHGTILACTSLLPNGDTTEFSIYPLLRDTTAHFFLRGYSELFKYMVPIMQRVASAPDIMTAYDMCPGAVLLREVTGWHTPLTRFKPLSPTLISDVLETTQLHRLSCVLLHMSDTPATAQKLRALPADQTDQLVTCLRKMLTSGNHMLFQMRMAYQVLHRLGVASPDDAQNVSAYDMLLLRFAAHQ